MSNAIQIEKDNQSYVSSFTEGKLALPPARQVAILTCMDARIDPIASLGLKLGDAHVIRNAGGRASEALRSILISERLLNTTEIVVFHHTDCGMLTFTDDQIRGIIKDQSGVPTDHIAFLPFNDLDESVRQDVKFLKSNPLIPDNIAISGYVYSVTDGSIRKIEA